MIAAAVGLLLVIPTVWLVRRQHWESWYYSGALIGLPLVYVAFALFAEGNGVVGKELLMGLPFFSAGLILLARQFRFSVYVTAAFWGLHGVYDLWHEELFINSGVVDWYPVFCAAIDIGVAVYLVWLATTVRSVDLSVKHH